MQRRKLLQGLATLLPLLPAFARASAGTSASGGAAAATARSAAKSAGKAITPLVKPHAAWKPLLTPAAYTVLFEEGTERAGSSPLNSEKHSGTYICAACYLPLFDSKHKFDSGTGWPSFTQGIAGHTGTKRDFKMILQRIEYHCIRCGGHQGHIFNDGPPPRGERWCNNGVAL